MNIELFKEHEKVGNGQKGLDSDWRCTWYWFGDW